MLARRHFLQAICSGALILSLANLGRPNQKQAEMSNFLFIMSDDHTSQAISAYGGMLASVCPTPNIDRIANEGMLFRNCFVTNSICTPSRSAIMMGKYAHKNGVYKFTALDQSQPTLPKLMRRAGYHTALVGKYHVHSNPVGLDYWSILPGQGRYHNPQFVEMGDQSPNGWVRDGRRTTCQGHSSDVIADKALDYLRNRRSKNKPFMFFCHFKAPHDTWEYAERYDDFLEDVEIPEPSNLFDNYQGRSFVQLLQGKTPANWRKSMYYRYYYSHFETEPHFGVRTYEHKLICFNRINQWELYDLKRDPLEMNNVYDDQDYRDVVKKLKQELERLQNELGDDPKDIGDNPRLGDLAPNR